MILDLPDWNCEVHYYMDFAEPKEGYQGLWSLIKIKVDGKVFTDPSDVDEALWEVIERELNNISDTIDVKSAWDQDWETDD